MDEKLTTRSDSAQRRAEIALAARDLIAEKGFEGLRTRDIAERVGINIATLHYHVPSKDALVELLAQSLSEQFAAQHMQGPGPGAGALERLRKEFADFRDTLLNNPKLMQAMTELSERARRDEKVAAVIAPMRANWARQIAAILAAGRDDGSFRPDIDPQAGAAMVMGAMVTARMTGANPQFFDRVAAEIERAVANRDANRDQGPELT